MGALMRLFATPTCSMTRSSVLEPSLHDLLFAPTMMRPSCSPTKKARMDIVEHKDKYDIVIDAPGLAPDDVSVKLEDGVLSVEGKHEIHETKEDTDGKVVYSERRRSNFLRRFALPDDADHSGINASQKDGVVTISIARSPPPAPVVRTIPVTRGTDADAGRLEGAEMDADATPAAAEHKDA